MVNFGWALGDADAAAEAAGGGAQAAGGDDDRADTEQYVEAKSPRPDRWPLLRDLGVVGVVARRQSELPDRVPERTDDPTGAR